MTMPITGTFLDEISHDIPSQNWGPDEWDREFRVMRDVGIDTVILIRCGYTRWTTYPSKVLAAEQNAMTPPLDLVDLFLTLSEKYGMKFLLGLYDSCDYWLNGQYQKEVDLTRKVVDEVWQMYGRRKAFAGWYLSQEVGRKEPQIVELYRQIAQHCRGVSGGLPIMISPFVRGVRRPHLPEQYMKGFTKGLAPDEHAKVWNEILDGIADVIDILAFHSAGAGWDYVDDYLAANCQLARDHGLESWEAAEAFDRDTRIFFPPIKWEKLLRWIEAAERAGTEKIITFEFSCFMSPNCCWPSGRNLFRRYCEHVGLDWREIEK
jgi:hypothetical protein